MSDVIDRAQRILAGGPNITYPSRTAAQEVRDIMRELIEEIIQRRAPDLTDGRDTVEAAKRLMGADDAWIALVAEKDPSMIRDVAAAYVYDRERAKEQRT